MIKKLTIMGTQHSVRWNARLKDDWGDFDAEKKLIRIAKAPLLQQRETLLHEVMHAIEEQYGFDMNHDHLTLMARGLLAVLRDNPEFREVLLGEE